MHWVAVPHCTAPQRIRCERAFSPNHFLVTWLLYCTAGERTWQSLDSTARCKRFSRVRVPSTSTTEAISSRCRSQVLNENQSCTCVFMIVEVERLISWHYSQLGLSSVSLLMKYSEKQQYKNFIMKSNTKLIIKQEIRSVEHGICPIAEFTSPWLNCAHNNRISYPLFCWCRDGALQFSCLSRAWLDVFIRSSKQILA